MSDEQNMKYRWIHGLMKGTISNVVIMAHKAIPSKFIISKPEDVKNTPEVANFLEAFDMAMKEFDSINSDGKGRWTNPDKDKYSNGDLLHKMKDIMATAAASDSAYYLMMEYVLRHYCLIKFKDTFGEQAVNDAYDKQWHERMKKLKENNNNVTSSN